MRRMMPADWIIHQLRGLSSPRPYRPETCRMSAQSDLRRCANVGVLGLCKDAAPAPGRGYYASRMDHVSPGWSLVSIGLEGQEVRIAGVSLWKVEWEPAGSSSITVAHPRYPEQRHQMSVYRVRGSSPEVLFAAGEFSNGVWGFYTRD